MKVYMHYLYLALLFQCIFAGEYKHLYSLLTIHTLIEQYLSNCKYNH